MGPHHSHLGCHCRPHPGSGPCLPSVYSGAGLEPLAHPRPASVHLVSPHSKHGPAGHTSALRSTRAETDTHMVGGGNAQGREHTCLVIPDPMVLAARSQDGAGLLTPQTCNRLSLPPQALEFHAEPGCAAQMRPNPGAGLTTWTCTCGHPSAGPTASFLLTPGDVRGCMATLQGHSPRQDRKASLVFCLFLLSALLSPLPVWPMCS